MGLDGVTNVEAIDVSGSKQFAEKYIVTFEQLLDHKDPSVGPGEATTNPATYPHHENTARRLFTFLPNVAANSLPRTVCLRISTL